MRKGRHTHLGVSVGLAHASMTHRSRISTTFAMAGTFTGLVSYSTRNLLGNEGGDGVETAPTLNIFRPNRPFPRFIQPSVAR